MSEEANTPELKDDVRQHQLAPNLNKLFLKAESAMELRNWSYAVSLIQAILVKEPGFLEGRKRLRLASVKENEGKRGIKMGGEALKVMKMQSQVKKDPLNVMVMLEKDVLAGDPYNPQGNELLYEAAVAAGLPVTAGFALQTVIDGDPENIKFYHKLGDFYMAREIFDKASEIFGKIVEKNRSDLEATKKFKDATARGSIASQKWDSEGDWRDLLKDKDASKDLESKGRAAMTPEMLQAQADGLAAEYAANQNNLDVTKRLAATYEELEQFESALSFYEWAFHLSNNDPSLEKKVANIREIVNKAHLDALARFVEENPEHPDIELYKSQLAEAEKAQIEVLIAESRERVDRNPTDNELRFELGSRLFRAGQYRESIQHLQQAKRSPNLRIRVMNLLGQCYENMNMTDLAATQYEEALTELPTMDEVKKELLYNLGLLYEKLGNTAKYMECLKQIYAVDYGYRDVAVRGEG
ncbi:MAG: tetratricopeptide repeat protein, partial [Verrucomicrobiales bacterium]